VTDTWEGRQTSRRAHYIRIKIINKRQQIVKKCRAYLVNVEEWDNSINNFKPTIYCDSLQLAWSAQTIPYRALDIPKKVPHFIDIVSTRQGSSNYKIMTKLRLHRYGPLFRQHGKFRYTVLISGDNVKPKSRRIIFEWSGNWDDFTATAGK
jgi:hypothetical protein